MEGEKKAFGPRPEDDSLDKEPCKACGNPFKKGEYTTLIPLGPGDDPEAMTKARMGRYYSAVAIEVHYSCATGEQYEAT